MEKENVLKELNDLIEETKTKIIPTKWYPEGVLGASYMVDGDLYAGWHTRAITFLKMFLPNESDFLNRFAECKKNYYGNAETSKAILESLVEYINKGLIIPEQNESCDASVELSRVFERFHRVVKQLRDRHDSRPTLDVNDEYDVQDLLHALLKLHFDDIRAEEWTPSYAGKSARMDFLLKNEGIVIEVKKTRQGLTDKEVGDQLIVDVERYKAHPDCKNLICFIYDPEGRIGNPEGIINDLNEQHKGFVKVVIEPRD